MAKRRTRRLNAVSQTSPRVATSLRNEVASDPGRVRNRVVLADPPEHVAGGELASRYVQHVAGDPARLVGAQVQCRRGDIVGDSDAAKRIERRAIRTLLVGFQPWLGQACLDDTRRDGVDAD